MKTLRCFCAIAIFATSFSLPFVSHAQTPQEREEIKAFLVNWKKTNLVEQTEILKLNRYGKNTLPLLAEFLPDKELGFNAQLAMDQLDPIGATPYKLKNLPNVDGNVQRNTFDSANVSLQQYEWHVRAEKPDLDPSKPAPNYPINKTPYPFTKEIHDAAVVCLQGMTQLVGREEAAIRTIGLTGTKRDNNLLKEYGKKFPEADWLCVMATAKLGDGKSLKLIESELKKPVVTVPAQGFSTDRGINIPAKPRAIVSELRSGQRLRVAMEQAAFTMNRRFIIPIAKHLDDPSGQRHGDYSDPDPSYFAKEALSKIVYGDPILYLKSESWKQRLKLPISKP